MEKHGTLFSILIIWVYWGVSLKDVKEKLVTSFKAYKLLQGFFYFNSEIKHETYGRILHKTSTHISPSIKTESIYINCFDFKIQIEIYCHLIIEFHFNFKMAK